MAFLTMIALSLARLFLEEGGGEPETMPLYRLADLTWWGALLLFSLAVFIVWLLMSWQANFFDRQMASESHIEHGHNGEIPDEH